MILILILIIEKNHCFLELVIERLFLQIQQIIIITFILPQNDNYDLDGCTNCELDFEFIKEINVYKKDSLVFCGNKEIIKNLYKNSEIKANRGVFHIY